MSFHQWELKSFLGLTTVELYYTLKHARLISMKNLYFLFAFTLFLLTGIPNIKAQYLVVEFQDGTVDNQQIALLQSIKYPDNELQLNYFSGLSDTYALSTIKTLHFQMYPTGANDISLGSDTKISVYPNPANDLIYIKNASETTYFVAIYRIDGVLISQKQISSNQPINISDLTSGLYLIRIENQAFKFIKQ